MEQLIDLTVAQLSGKVAQLRSEGCRLVQIMCSMVGQDFELTYNFDKSGDLTNLRLTVPAGGDLPSITEEFLYAFIWENEIHDLFGLQFTEMVPDFDYHGKFFHLEQATPWNPGTQGVVPKGLGIDASVKAEGGANNA